MFKRETFYIIFKYGSYHMIFFYFYIKISYQSHRFRMNPTSSPFDERAWKDRNLLCACGVLVCRGALELYYTYAYHNKKEYDMI